MRRRKAQGFTLIELLIVIAIIGILAAVLIPNLLGARRAAQERAAQAFGNNVYTALSGYLAQDTTLSSGAVLNAFFGSNTGGSCNGANTNVSGWTWNSPGTYITCTAAQNGPDDFTVDTSSTSGSHTYTNGKQN